MKARALSAASAALAATLLVGSPVSASPERLQGSWAIDAVTCDQAFTQRHGRQTFKKHFGESWSSFIVNGKQVRGPNSTCDLISTKQKGEVLTLLLSCANEIIFETSSIPIRFINDDKLVRFDPEFPEIETTYNRCSR